MKKSKEIFPHKFVRSRADLTGIMILRAFASNSQVVEYLEEILDLGEIIIESSRDFTVPEQLTNTHTVELHHL